MRSPMKRCLFLLPFAIALTGCDEKNKPAPVPSTTVSVTTAAPSAAALPPSSAPKGPKPAESVVRYANELAVEQTKTTVTFDMNVRYAPNKQDGDVIVALRAGTEVTKLSKRGQWYLVSFADPKDSSKTLTGWIWEQAFAPSSGPGDENKLCACYMKENDAGTCEAVSGSAKGECDRTFGNDCKKLLACARGEAKPTCGTGERLLTQGTCAKVCKTNAGCKNDQMCTDKLGTPSVCISAKPVSE
jgi:hypothetical protein